MHRADWPAQTTIALCEGRYATLVRQLTAVTHDKTLAVKMLLRALMRSSGETDAVAFEEPRRPVKHG